MLGLVGSTATSLRCYKRWRVCSGLSLDQLASGSLAEQAAGQLTDHQLLNMFTAIQEMPEDDRQTIKRLIDAFIAKKKIQELANS